MGTIKNHLIVTEHVDRRGRHWCRVCGLPSDNARARRLHSAALAAFATDPTRHRYERDTG